MNLQHPDNIDEFMSWTPPLVQSMIGNGILDYQARLVIFGKYKSWKSMIAMHTAFCISTGSLWFGHLTTKVPVLVIQVEVSKSNYQKRAKKYYRSYNIKYENPNYLHIVSQPYGFRFDQTYDLDRLDKWISRQRDLCKLKQNDPQVIIIDPLYKCFGGNTNDPHEVNKFLTNLDFLMLKHGCSFIVIHHERKSVIIQSGLLDTGAENAGGAVRIIDWCDGAVELVLKEDNKVQAKVKATFMAMRNTEEFLEPIVIRCIKSNLSFIPVSDTLDISPVPIVESSEEDV